MEPLSAQHLSRYVSSVTGDITEQVAAGIHKIVDHILKASANGSDALALNLRDCINKFFANVLDIFEELIHKFAEASNETAGERFTPSKVIELMVILLLADCKNRAQPSPLL